LWSKELAAEPLEGLVAITQTLQIDQKAAYQVIGYPLNVFRQKPTIDIKIIERTALGNLLTDEAILALEERNSPALAANVLSIQSHLVPGHSGAPSLNQLNQVVAIGNGGLDTGRVEMGWAMPWDELELSTIAVGVSQQVSWVERARLRELGNSDSGFIFAYSTLEYTHNPEFPDTIHVDKGISTSNLISYMQEGSNQERPAIARELVSRVLEAQKINEQVIVALTDALENAENAEVRKAAAESLGKLGSLAIPSLPSLVKAQIYDKNFDVREVAKNAVEQIVGK